MITRFNLHNVATYKNKVEISGLKKLNFFYGTNGSGKTTISRVLADCNNPVYSDCSVINEFDHAVYVYNQDFINRHFYQKDGLDGVFTLGGDAEAAEKEISRIRDEIDIKKSEILQKNAIVAEDGAESLKFKMKEVKNQKIDNFWKFKLGLEEKSNLIRILLEGFHNNKEKFFNEILRYSKTIDNEIKVNFEEIIKKAEVVLEENIQKKSEVVKITQSSLQAFYPINEMTEVLVNSNSNNQISEMIARLNHTSWFEQGINHSKNNSGFCPFCSQKIDDELNALIKNCFDQTYKDKKEKINQFLESYKIAKDNLLILLKNKIDELRNGIDIAELEIELQFIELILLQNINLIESKILGGVLKSMLALNEPIIDVKEG